MPLVSVVIPAHNAGATIAAQLGALTVQVDPPPFEVVVVLNRCTDDTATIAGQFFDRLNLNLVTADEKASASFARNSGFAASTGDAVLFCDADDRVGEKWVAAMAAELRKDDIGFVGGPIVIDREGLPDWMYARFYAWFDNLYLKPGDEEVRPPCGSLGVTRTAFEFVGGFDESLATCEDSDLTQRMMDAGFGLGIAFDAVLRCKPRTTIRAVVRQQRWYAIGTAQLLAKQGRLAEPPLRRDELRTDMRWLAHLVVRQRVVVPGRVWTLFAVRRAQQKERRRVWLETMI